MTTFVYLGPSLPRAEAEAILQAEYLDPIAMGDLYTLVKSGAKPGDRVAIIDGFFEQVPAVWHKEILYAIENRILVYGASSMGALRAAELCVFGMRGMGRIFEAYRDGIIEDDDEVAVAHATREDGYRSLSTAMVSIRFGLARLREKGRLSAYQHDLLHAYAKSQHYNVRSWADTYAHALKIGLGDDALAAIREIADEVDAKAQDAITLLRYLSNTGDAREKPPEPGFVLEQTGFWRALVQSQESRIAGESFRTDFSTAVIDPDIVTHVRASSPARDALLREAVLMKVALESSSTSTPTAKEMKAAVFRIAVRNDLRTSEEMRAWREKQRLGDNDWKSLLEIDARMQQLVHNTIPTLDLYLLAALKASGHYADALSNVAATRERHGENWLKELSAEDCGITYGELQEWYERNVGPMLPDPETHAQALGFQTLAGFATEILAAYLLTREMSIDSVH